MTDFTLRLPPEKSSMERLGRLDQGARDKFTQELLHALWESEEAGELPPRIAHLLRGWVAHARFEDDPVTQERRLDAQRRAAGA